MVVLIRMVRPTIVALTGRAPSSSDHWGHLAFIATMRARGRTIAGSLPCCMVKRNAYPLLYHWILTWFPSTVARLLARYTRSIVDGLFYIIVVFLFHWFYEIPDKPIFFMMTTLLLALTPLITRPRTGLVEVRERFFGVLVGNLYLLNLLLIHYSKNIGLIISAVLIFQLLVITSKFGVQAALFIGTAIGIISMDLSILAAIVAGLVVGLTVFRTSVGHFLKAHLLFSVNYWKSYDGYFIKDFNRIYFPRSLAKKELGKAVRSIDRNSYIWTIVGLPFLIPVFLLFLQSQIATLPNQFDRMFMIWTVASLGVVAVTGFWKFKVLGEAMRYNEYALVPYLILVLRLYLGDHMHNDLFVVIFVASFVIVLINLLYDIGAFTCRREKLEPIFQSMDEIAKLLPKNAVVVFDPVADGHYLVWRHPSNGYRLVHSLCHHDLTELDIRALYGGRYPHLNIGSPELAQLLNKYGVEFVVEKRDENNAGKFSDCDRFETIGSHSHYHVFRVKLSDTNGS